MLKRLAALGLAAIGLAGCVNANDAAHVPISNVLYTVPPGRIVFVTEDSMNLPFRGDRDVIAGASYTQVDLATQHAVMVGLNPAYMTGYRLYDGDATDDRGFAQGSARTRFQIASAPGPVDYALTLYYRNDGVWLENKCYYDNAIVFRLKPGVINYIPKELQPPLFRGRVNPAWHPDTTELQRVLKRFPISNMPIEVARVVAIVKFAPNKFEQALGGRCFYNDDFTILTRYDTSDAH